jgi:hypothetical protein
VPAGIWAAEEYARLTDYDAATGEQPTAVFLCHQYDLGSDSPRMCAGWAGCHDTANLLSLRLAVSFGALDEDTLIQVIDYQSPVPLFDSGSAAAEHGVSGIADPDAAALTAITKIRRHRGDLT